MPTAKIHPLWQELFPDWQEGECPGFGNSVDCYLSTNCPAHQPKPTNSDNDIKRTPQ